MPFRQRWRKELPDAQEQEVQRLTNNHVANLGGDGIGTCHEIDELGRLATPT